MDEDDLAAAEAARDRRRDRRIAAHERDLMRTGPAKVFKQILDVQEKRARADEDADAVAVERSDARPAREHHRRHGHAHGHEDERDR